MIVEGLLGLCQLIPYLAPIPITMAIADCSHNKTQLWVIISCLSNQPMVRTKHSPEGDDNGHTVREDLKINHISIFHLAA